MILPTKKKLRKIRRRKVLKEYKFLKKMIKELALNGKTSLSIMIMEDLIEVTAARLIAKKNDNIHFSHGCVYHIVYWEIK